MKKVIFIAGVSVLSFFSYSQNGKVKVTDIETGITYLTNEISQGSNGTLVNMRPNDVVPGGGLEIAMVMAGGHLQGLNGQLKVINGPAERGELDDFNGNSQGFAKLCKDENIWPCMVLWIKKEKI